MAEKKERDHRAAALADRLEYFRQVAAECGNKLEDREREIGRLQALADSYKAAAQEWQKRADDLAGRLAVLERYTKTLDGDRDAALAKLNRMREANGIDRELLNRAQNEISELAGRIQTALDALEPEMRKANGIDRELLNRSQNEISELAGRIQTALDALEPDREA